MSEIAKTPGWEQAVIAAEKHFIEVVEAEGTAIVFKKEALFAMQAIKNSEWLQKCDRSSIQDAVINVASIGISLNPAEKLAYLVPRDNRACLDISSRGLVKLATDSGNIQWAKSVLVYEDDTFKFHGFEIMPTHDSHPFKKNRGEIIGGFCAAKLNDGSYLVDTMSREDLDHVKSTSKAQNGPWKSWPEEMMKKTLIKRASKTWPNNTRLMQAVQIINEHEGLEDKYLNGTSNQVSPEPVDASKVLQVADQIKGFIDADIEEDQRTADLKDVWKPLTNDEKIRVQGMLKEKAPDTKRMYSTILKDYVSG